MLERLRDILMAYGAEPARWPSAEKQGLLDLLARDATARRLQSEAAALDRVLGLAPIARASGVRTFEDRIVAAAERMPRVAVENKAPVGTRSAAGRTWGDRRLSGAGPGAAALLAASLVFGIYLGTAELPASLVDGLVQTAGLAESADLSSLILEQSETFSENLL